MRQDRMLARSEPRHLREAWNDPSWQKIWLAIQAQDWRSLAIVPASRGVSTLELAQILVDVGWQHRGLPIGLADLRNITLPYIDSVIEEVTRHVASGERVLIALRSVFENPATVPIAQWADGALLCVSLGHTRMTGAEQTLEQIGKSRFLGSVVVRGASSTQLAVRR